MDGKTQGQSLTKDEQNLPPPQTRAEYQACKDALQNQVATSPANARSLNAFQTLIDAMLAENQVPPSSLKA